ncbi:hypothetical protein [Reyranella sp.]|uniref:hypothetical protein n=1 Tax=Reyranella sp. TaxID=1929291 RepID=UPI0040369AE9
MFDNESGSPEGDRVLPKQRNLILVLEAIADCKDLKPGLITQPYLSALAKIPMLAHLDGDPHVAALLVRIGLTPERLRKERQSIPPIAASQDHFAEGFIGETITPEMAALRRLSDKAKHAVLTSEFVVRTLLEKPEAEAVRKALILRASNQGKVGADAMHVEHRERREKIRAVWASGKYATKVLCAEQECEHHDMSFDTARKALKGAPDPYPWPGQRPSRR